VRAAGGAAFVFRTSWVYGARRSNFFLAVRQLAREGASLRIVDDQTGAPTWCRSVAEATMQVLRRLRAAGAGESGRSAGLYHMSCTGRTTWYGFARAFLPAGVPVAPVSSGEYAARAARPAFSVLDGRRLRQVFGVRLPSWRAALARCTDALDRAGA